MRIGFVGLGLMGSPMAMHLVRAGLDVAVYNRTALRAEPHREAGAVVCKSLGELGRLCDKIFICVSDTPDVDSVIFDPGGLADSLAEGALIVDHSTISPSASRGFAQRLAGLGVGFVDAPVSGGTKGAHEGKLTVMMGGSERDVARTRPIVSIYAAKVSHIGPVGSGQLMKCCNQLVAGLHVLALAEGFRFAGRLGLDQATAHDAIGSGAAGSFIWKHWGAQLLEGNLNPGFKISLHRKDLHLVLEECQKSGLDLPGLKLLVELYDRAVEEGLGELGDQALGRVFKD